MARKPAAKKAATDKAQDFGFYQNKEGRVFVGTREITKQAKTNKFGLVRITKGIYDEAMAGNGLTQAIVDIEDDAE